GSGSLSWERHQKSDGRSGTGREWSQGGAAQPSLISEITARWEEGKRNSPTSAHARAYYPSSATMDLHSCYNPTIALGCQPLRLRIDEDPDTHHRRCWTDRRVSGSSCEKARHRRTGGRRGPPPRHAPSCSQPGCHR